MNFNNSTNTSKYPVTEILYGEYQSKYIFKLNLDDLKANIENGKYVLTTNTIHYLNLTNCIFADNKFLGQINGRGWERTTSFDLILFVINEEWSAGSGYELGNSYDFSKNNKTYDLNPSNWYFRTENDVWAEEGIYLTAPSEIIDTIHFDNGLENLKINITDYVNEILLGQRTNYGLGIAFHPNYDALASLENTKSVSFFAKNTQTYYEPYVESCFPDDIILDDRDNFVGGQENNLYLYATRNGVYYDFAELPVVNILDNTQQPISGLTNLTTTKVRKGIYKVRFKLNNNQCDGTKFYFDKWENIKVFDYYLQPVIKRFTPKPLLKIINIGNNPVSTETYNVKINGLQFNEKIKRGDDRKISLQFKTINNPNSIVFDQVYYRLRIKEYPNSDVIVYDWSQMDRTNENSFILDTSFLIPRDYFLDLKFKKYGQEVIITDKIKFEIVSTEERIIKTAEVDGTVGFSYTFNFTLS
jgi:hypothetical protein